MYNYLHSDIYVEYRVYSGRADIASCKPENVSSARFIAEATSLFTLEAVLDKVSRSNFNPPRINEAEMWLPGENAEPVGNDISAFRDLHNAPDDDGPFNLLEPYNYQMHWDEMTDLLIEDSSSSTNWETYTYRGALMEYDGGMIGKPKYKVTANCFSVKMGFVEGAGNSIASNEYTTSTTQGYHQRLIQAELVDHGAGGNGWGIEIANTFIYDDSSGGYDNLGRGLVSGNTFRLE